MMSSDAQYEFLYITSVPIHAMCMFKSKILFNLTFFIFISIKDSGKCFNRIAIVILKRMTM